MRPLFGAIAQLGERNTGSVEVSGSIRLAPPNINPPRFCFFLIDCVEDFLLSVIGFYAVICL